MKLFESLIYSHNRVEIKKKSSDHLYHKKIFQKRGSWTAGSGWMPSGSQKGCPELYKLVVFPESLQSIPHYYYFQHSHHLRHNL